MTLDIQRHPASFRDPSGFVFRRNGNLYRQINPSYQKQYDHIMSSGLYGELIEQGLMIYHNEVEAPTSAYKLIQPQLVPFISYPYEWCFSQLKDAALLTLKIARLALDKNMVLKDASAYNIQFIDGMPILIDTLSFDMYVQGKLWEAYRQFCQHFLAPLALAAYSDIRFLQLSKMYIDGIPLDLASKLLPWFTNLDLNGLGMHIHIHARMQSAYSSRSLPTEVNNQMDKRLLINLYDRLEKIVQGLMWKVGKTEWGNYYQITNYDKEAFETKKRLTEEMICTANPMTLWDLGANNGLFSRLASEQGIFSISSDIDYSAVEYNYHRIREKREKNLLPLVIDLTNPSPAIGWQNMERDSLTKRKSVDLVMALALIHHLCISNNVPLELVAEFFARLGRWAIVEFVPKQDSQVKRLLSSRKDIFDNYDEEGFENAFALYFDVIDKRNINGSKRTLYLLRNRSNLV